MMTSFPATSLAFCFCAWSSLAALAQTPAPPDLDRYNVIWTTPSKNAAGAMPIGNGEVGLNVWVEENGDLLFYLARTDAWSECCRLLKLGRVRVSLSPNPFAKGQPFRQELRLRDGQIVITAGDVALRIFVDAAAPVVYVTGEANTPRTITVTFETWRSERHTLNGEELSESCWTMRSAPADIEVWESPDVVTDSTRTAVLWYHRNAYSVVPLTLKHQGIESLANLVRDPLLNRTFGGKIVGEGFVNSSPDTLKSVKPVTQLALAIVTHTSQAESAADWQNEAAENEKKIAPAAAAARTVAWWNQFWQRSWIHLEGDTSQSRVTEAYILQRWISECGARGNYPIKFNGSIFTVDPKFSGGPDLSPDWRSCGDAFWWQNTRLPYSPMCANGDFDEIRALFRFYRNALPLCRARAKLYHNVEGAYFPETMTIFGTYSNGDYGWDRKGRQPKEVLAPWWQYAWQQGLELSGLMLDYYEHTEDPKFLAEELIPVAHDVLRYFDTRFRRDGMGKLVISPTQSVETYCSGVINDTPTVAGLNNVLDRLLALPVGATPAAERDFWQRMKAAAPPLPLHTENGKTRVSPAEKFDPQRTNFENPELYAIWPFPLFGVGRPDLATGAETFLRRIEKASFGWQYDGQCAARVGLVDEAKQILLGKVITSTASRRFGNSHANHRFPAMWGPNFDWLPDQCHGSNIMLTLQHMLIDSVGDKIVLLPAWPKEWNVSFKLHAPRQTVVECVYRAGRIEKLDVYPKKRMNDVQYPLGLSYGAAKQ